MFQPVRPGDVLAGRYRLDAVIGEGGFGVVYRATETNLGRAVALKLVRPEMLYQADGLERFRREAALAQRLSHPNTVRVYDFGRTEQGVPFIVWELLEGESLEHVLRREGRLHPERAQRIASQILKSLMEAHALGIVHRDIKPANVFLCRFVHGETDFVKLLDFGIAKSTRSRSMGALTEQGMMIGSPSYMSPEQVRGEEVAPSADVYSTGLVLAEMLAGAPVFRGRSGVDVCMAQLSDAPAPIPHDVLSGPFGPVVHAATQKVAAHRFPTAAEMLRALEAVQVPGRASGASVPTPIPLSPAPGSYAPTSYAVQSAPPVAAYPVAPMASYPQAPHAGAPIAPTMNGPYPAPQGVYAPGPEVPARPRRGGLVAAVVVLVVLVLGAGSVAVLAATGTISGLGPSASLGELTPDQIRGRIERTGYRVVTATPMALLQTRRWTWNVQSRGSDATIQWVRFADVLSAKVEQETCLGAAERDGTTVLCVSVDIDDEPKSKKLLAQILR